MTIRLLVFCFIFFQADTIHAQVVEHQVIDRGGGNGSLTYLFQHEEISGTQFLKDDWQPGQFVNSQGYVFKDMSLKFDVYNHKFVYNIHDTAYELTSGIRAVVIFPRASDTTQKQVFKNGYAIDKKINPAIFLQVLAEGKITFLKYYVKEVEEYNEYGNANKLKRFKDLQKYFILENGQYTPVTPGRKALEDLLQSRWPGFSGWMKEAHNTGNDETAWKEAISHYNAL